MIGRYFFPYYHAHLIVFSICSTRDESSSRTTSLWLHSSISYSDLLCNLAEPKRVYCVRAAAAPHVETFVLLRHFANRKARINVGNYL